MTEDQQIDGLEHLSPEARLEASLNQWLDLLTEKEELRALVYDEKGHHRPGYEQHWERFREIRDQLPQATKELERLEEKTQVRFSGGPARNPMTEVTLSLSSRTKPRQNQMSLWEGRIMQKRIDELEQKKTALGSEPVNKLQKTIIELQIGAINNHFESAAYSRH